ncbi:EAL domain-containing protein [uncultured Maritalea sp.]|uniref:putative bifunctional diguanylate cyclase/phosphodiesterase n=1 Tax=uncultured Maritalea sp. TaxID=757249 RepID=UPI0026043B43|nr:EAL domain-containing protein [uncultured Maritalea sp.]
MSRFGFVASLVFLLAAFTSLVFASAFMAPGIVQQLSGLDARLLARDWLVSMQSQFELPGEPIPFKASVGDNLAAFLLQQRGEGSSEVDLFRPIEFQSLEHFGNITGYAVFTKFGELFIAGGRPQLRSLDNQQFASVVKKAMSQNITVVFPLEHRVKLGKPSQVVVIPLTRFNGPRGVVSIEVERHNIEGVMERGVQFTSFLTAGILAFLALVVMVTLFYWGRQRRKAEREAIRLAFFDPLTGLPNRRKFHMDLPRIVDELRGQNGDKEFGLLSIDVDKFKAINDLYGHSAGDAVLNAIGRRLVENLGAQDSVFRLSGDEFVVILSQDFEFCQLSDICGQLVEAMEHPIEVEQSHILASVSIGAVAFPMHGDDEQLLLKRSDLALYDAKDNGRSGFTVFSTALEQEMRHKARLERDLRQALELDQLHLHYQPQVDACSGELLGFEALARWTHPELGAINPEEFVGIAEQSGLIHKLGQWALSTACEEAAKWEGGLTIAVNLSPLQLRDAQIVLCVQRVLHQSGLAPERLELEITEGVFVYDTSQVRHTLDELRSLGVGIAMDDFGTGYSSLSYLTRIPLTKLKIDRAFVSNFHLGKADDAVVHCVVGLSKSLRLQVVAEGVETQSQVQALQLAGCDILQGYYFGRPTGAPHDVIEAFADRTLKRAG